MADLTWKGIETQDEAQLLLPGFSRAPTAAEGAFLALASRWAYCVQRLDRSRAFPREVDVCALACLLVASEWGVTFSGVAHELIEANCAIVDSCRGGSWIDRLSWELCGESLSEWRCASRAFDQLAANLDHHNSSIRIWMMEIGWMVQPRLDRKEAVSRLLSNLAETIFEPHLAADLAARFFPDFVQFIAHAQSYEPPSQYEEQYRSRLENYTKEGSEALQTPFWQLECECRKMIESASLGRRLSLKKSVPPA